MKIKLNHSLLTITALLLSACQHDTREAAHKMPADSKDGRLARVEQDVSNFLTKNDFSREGNPCSCQWQISCECDWTIKCSWNVAFWWPHSVRHSIEKHSWALAGWSDDHATYLPHLTSVAASCDVEIAGLHGQVLGAEARERKKILSWILA